jgi:hypothetical protein
MLFTAWRNEDVDLLKGCKTYEESYFQQKDVIESTRSGYERIQSGIDQNLMIDEEDLENYNIHNIVPEVQHAEAIDLAEIPSVVEALGCFIPESTCSDPHYHNAGDMYDIGQDLGIARKRLELEQLPYNELSNDDFLVLVQNLNIRQK